MEHWKMLCQKTVGACSSEEEEPRLVETPVPVLVTRLSRLSTLELEEVVLQRQVASLVVVASSLAEAEGPLA